MTVNALDMTPELLFQSTPSAWRETRLMIHPGQEYMISIHSLRMEGDRCTPGTPADASYFNPLPPHGGRLRRVPCWIRQKAISIHSLRMEGDENGFLLVDNIFCISIHSLRMEGDAADRPKRSAVKVFQSTPSAWRETQVTVCVHNRRTHFNPLPPHGGRLISKLLPPEVAHFNPLPPHGGRLTSLLLPLKALLFQSTPSAWRETLTWQSAIRP